MATNPVLGSDSPSGGRAKLNADIAALDTGKAAAVHNHDDRYYTEAEVATLLAGKWTLWRGTQAQYDALSTPRDTNTLFAITG